MPSRFSHLAGGTAFRLFLTAAAVVLCGVAVLLGALPTSPVPIASSQAQFAHPAFRAAWERTDGLVATGAVLRPWVWGPVPGRSLTEPFQGIPGNSHLVQYFDKGRMELNNPAADPTDPFYVTNGLLAVELISGLMQTGTGRYEVRRPAAINLASDADDPSAPTYQSFNGVSNIPGAPNRRRSAPRVGQVVREAIDRQGITQPWPSNHPDYGVRIVHYEEVTGHNIPNVFWEYLNQQTEMVQDARVVRGPLFYPWFAVTGYPISEPYWSYVKVQGQYRDVLIQAFERRVLTYVPHLPSPFKVQMGNTGMHYYEWRYSTAPTRTPAPPRATPTSPALPPLARITIDRIEYRKSITDLNGNFAIITNRDQRAYTLNGWWLDSPKWSHVDRFYFPDGVTIAPGASIRVHSGPGVNTDTDIYMWRTTVMWDGMPYDLAVLYDNYGREVDRFFPAADVGVPPTPPPVVTGTPGATSTPSPTATRGTPGPTATITRTPAVPSPVSTGAATVGTATALAFTSPTPMVTGTPPTRTPTHTATPTR
jgi:hypothetical protein